MKASESSLIETVRRHIPPHLRLRPLLAAFSGGLDSTVLLHLLARLRDEGALATLTAVHVHHGLHPEADRWAENVERICRELQVPLVIERIEVQHRGEGIESAARKARYAALARHLEPGGVLLTAHHRNDQAETFLLQLMRGAGVRGLAAMPALAPFAEAWHLRPLLDVGRETLASYAIEHGLHWIDDPSNADPRHARNLVRHQVLPRLHAHWPQAEAILAQAARRMAITEGLLEALGRMDLEPARTDQADRLEVAVLLRLPEQRLLNALRTWLLERGLPLPPEARLMEVRRMLEARPDALPILRWRGAELRRWRGGLYALREQAQPARDFSRTWHAQSPLDCPELGWRCVPHTALGRGLRRAAVPPEGLTIRLRRGGENIRLASHHQTLKNLLQASSIPPWERERLPLFFIGDQLVQAGEQWIDAAWRAGPDEPGVHIELHRLDPHRA